MKMQMRQGLRFIARGCLFILPIFLVIGIPIFIMWQSGELASADSIVAREVSSQPVTAGLILSDPTDYIELHAAIAENPKVLILGSSQVRQIRTDFFNPGVTMYNAGHVIQKINYLNAFLDKIPSDQTPKLLLIGLHPKLFDPSYDSLATDTIDTILTVPTSLTDTLSNWSLVYQYYFEKKYTLSQVFNATDSIGLLADANHEGYRNDGSYDPGTDEYSPASLNDSFIASITDGTNGFEHSPIISQGALEILDAFLAECKARNITVIGFVPPFSPAVYQDIVAHPGEYGYVTALTPSITPIFQKYGFSFFNFVNPGSLPITNTNMQDGEHLTERGSLIMFIDMAEHSAALRSYTNLANLQRVLASTTAQTDVFPAEN
jgi:hypothetical protein